MDKQQIIGVAVIGAAALVVYLLNNKKALPPRTRITLSQIEQLKKDRLAAIS